MRYYKKLNSFKSLKEAERFIRNQELRITSLKKTSRTKKMISTLFSEDVKDFNSDKIAINQRTRIGFN